MKKLFIPFLLLSFLFAGVAFAQDDQEAEEIVESETTTISDLGVEDPGLLPTSPFYFFKEIRRGLQRVFTFNAVKKTELELRFTNEKAAELKKVEEIHPGDDSALRRALENYENAQDRLKRKFERLEETSENPNVDRLLEQLADRVVKHEKLFEELEAKHDTVKSIIQNIRGKIEDTAGEASEHDDPRKFRERLERAFERSEGSDFKHLRSVGILERIRDKAPERVREQLDGLREDLSEKVRGRIEQLLGEEEGEERLKRFLEHVPGDALRRSVLLEELRGRVSDRAGETLDKLRDAFDTRIEEFGDFAERVEEQIARAEEAVARAAASIEEKGEDAPGVAHVLLEQAQEHLESAKIAQDEGQSGHAFGLARSAEAIARNILRILEMPGDLAEEIPERLDRIRDRIIDSRPDFPSTDAILCTLEYAPVCGADGKTYSNRCFAKNRGQVEVVYTGRCEAEEPREGRRYESYDVARCALIQLFCAEGFRVFSDETGCGCEVRERLEDLRDRMIDRTEIEAPAIERTELREPIIELREDTEPETE